MQDDLCAGGCGQPRTESFARGSYDLYRARPLVCHACAERDRAAKAHQDGPNADAAGLFFAVTKTRSVQ